MSSKKYNNLKEWAKDTCDAIREKDGTSEPISHEDIPERIKAIRTGHDPSGVTATANDVSENVKFLSKDGLLIQGAMPEISGEDIILDASTIETIIPEGHHDGTEKIKIVPETDNTFTPTSETQEITAPTGKVYTKVIIKATEAVDLSGVTATANDVIQGKKFLTSEGALTYGLMQYKGAWIGSKTGAGTISIPEGYHNGSGYVKVNNASIEVDNSNGTTARANHILSGYTCQSNGSRVTGSIESQDAQTIIPSTSDQIMPSGVYLSGNQTIKGDTNLIANNIKKGIDIFGVTGSYASGYSTEIWNRSVYESGSGASIELNTSFTKVHFITMFMIDTYYEKTDVPCIYHASILFNDEGKQSYQAMTAGIWSLRGSNDENGINIGFVEVNPNDEHYIHYTSVPGILKLSYTPGNNSILITCIDDYNSIFCGEYKIIICGE